MPQAADTPSGTLNAATLRAVIDDCIARRAAGEHLPDEAVIAAHPELMPALRAELRKVEFIAGAVAAADRPTAAASGTAPETLTNAPATRSAEVAIVAPPPPPDLFPGYEIQRELSRGGQGVVFQALQLDTKRKVAIKVLLEGELAADDARRRFEREIELAAQLDHPHIVTVFHSGLTERGQRFYVMDFVDGLPAHRYVRGRNLALTETLQLFVKICDAIAHAHQRGIIHRDLKPSNVLVLPDGSPRVLDFGLAKGIYETEDLTLTQTPMGTLPYMSPEQTRGNKRVDTRTDVYALGVMLYELLTGRFPYEVTGPLADVLRNITSVEPTPPIRAWSPERGIGSPTTGWRRWRFSTSRQARCPIDHDLQTILLKTLTKEPARRYQSVAELGRDLTHYLRGEAIEAKRDASLYILWKLITRNAGAAVGVAAGLLLLVSSMTIIAYFEHERAAALQRLRDNDTQLASESRSFEQIAPAALETARQAALGLFVEQWRSGRIALAQRQVTLVPPRSAESLVMHFLLDDRLSVEQLRAALAPDKRYLADYAAAQRALRDGRQAEARDALRKVLTAVQEGEIAALARDRLAQLSEATENSP